MSIEILISIFTTFIICLIGALAYSIRIVAINTGKIASSFAVFNILMLISRTANTFQGPILGNYIREAKGNVYMEFTYILISAFLAMTVGIFLIPTSHRFFTKFVNAFEIKKSIIGAVSYGFHKMGKANIKECVKIPSKDTIKTFDIEKLPKKILLFNAIATSVITVAIVAPLYSSYKYPDYATTLLYLSGVVNGIATILLVMFVDPHISMKVDDVVKGKVSDLDFRKLIIGMSVSRAVGGLISIFLLLPIAELMHGIAVFIGIIF